MCIHFSICLHMESRNGHPLYSQSYSNLHTHTHTHTHTNTYAMVALTVTSIWFISNHRRICILVRFLQVFDKIKQLCLHFNLQIKS